MPAMNAQTTTAEEQVNLSRVALAAATSSAVSLAAYALYANRRARALAIGALAATGFAAYVSPRVRARTAPLARQAYDAVQPYVAPVTTPISNGAAQVQEVAQKVEKLVSESNALVNKATAVADQITPLVPLATNIVQQAHETAPKVISDIATATGKVNSMLARVEQLVIQAEALAPQIEGIVRSSNESLATTQAALAAAQAALADAQPAARIVAENARQFEQLKNDFIASLPTREQVECGVVFLFLVAVSWYYRAFLLAKAAEAVSATLYAGYSAGSTISSGVSSAGQSMLSAWNSFASGATAHAVVDNLVVKTTGAAIATGASIVSKADAATASLGLSRSRLAL